jgi:hypothetical protein
MSTEEFLFFLFSTEEYLVERCLIVRDGIRGIG